MRKDKLRLQSSPDHAQDSFAATSTLERKHKKKHKCQDDLCKHRKHKKRRKHKKHHHRELDEEDRDLQHHVQSAMSISNDSNNNEEEFDEDSLSLNESVTQYEIVQKVGEDMVIKDDPDTMESSVTESSGSIYVSLTLGFKKIQRNFFIQNVISLLRAFRNVSLNKFLNLKNLKILKRGIWGSKIEKFNKFEYIRYREEGRVHMGGIQKDAKSH